MADRRKRSIIDILNEYFEDLEELAEQLEERLSEKPSWNCRTCTIEPLRDMMVTAREVIVTVDLPYSEKNTIQVKPIDKNTIEISAEMKRKIRLDELGIVHHKGEFQRFYCRTRIPVPIYMDKMKFLLKKGILEIHLPRKDEYEIPIE